MKNLIVFITLLLFKSAHAQLDKGIWLVGGSGSFYTYTEDLITPSYNQTANYTSTDIAASIGYFIIDKLAAGLRPEFSSYKGKAVRTSVGSGGYMNNYQFGIGPFARYYFLNSEKAFNLLADVSYQIGINKNFGGLNDKGKYNTFSFMGGTEMFFNQTAGIEILLGYRQKIVSIENSPSSLSNNKKGFQVSIGFQLHLEKD